ncbi:MAG: NUDIX hydrolase, partial [Anaerolineales bacterium]
AQEEIGLHPQDVTLVGQLTDLLTVTNYRIIPVVGIIPYPYPLEPNPLEVTRIFTIPILWLADKRNYKIEPRNVPPPVGIIQTIYYAPYDGEKLWGASAQIVHNLLALLEQKTP